MAFVMIAGPQILSAVFLATSEHWQRNTAADLAGATLSITPVVSLAYLLSPGAPREGGSNQTVNVVVLVLLLAAMVHVFLARKQSEPPKWMGKLQTANPRLAFTLGFLLLGVFPTDILTSVAAASGQLVYEAVRVILMAGLSRPRPVASPPRVRCRHR
jgi:hypothetical protein